MYLFSLGGKSIGEILSYKNYWLSVGVANGLILIGYLMMYRVDAQNIALNENDLEDTEWLSVKRLKKLKEFQVYDYKSAEEKKDGIVIGAEKKGGSVEVITTSQFVSFGSKQLYATTFRRRHYVDDKRERFGRREYGRKSERGIYYRAGRTFYKTPFRNAFHYADVQGTCRKGKSEPAPKPNENGNSETQYLLCVRRVCEPSEIREYRGNGNGSAFARHTVFVRIAVVFATDREVRQGRWGHYKDKLQRVRSLGIVKKN